MPGEKIGKIAQGVTQVITSAAKIHAGQLVELARQIQIEEIKNRLAEQYP